MNGPLNIPDFCLVRQGDMINCGKRHGEPQSRFPISSSVAMLNQCSLAVEVSNKRKNQLPQLAPLMNLHRGSSAILA